MAELNKDLKKVYEVFSILSYFKLIRAEKKNFNKDYDAFKSFRCVETYFKEVIKANKANYIQLRDNNYNILTNLRIKMDGIDELLDKLENSRDIYVQYLSLELTCMDWLDEAIEDIMPNETGYETIINNASEEVYNKLIKLEFLNMTSRDQDRAVMLERVKEIKEIAKSR